MHFQTTSTIGTHQIKHENKNNQMWPHSNTYIDQTHLGNKMNNTIVHSSIGALETNGSRPIVQA
jgi:hypothetical protein